MPNNLDKVTAELNKRAIYYYKKGEFENAISCYLDVLNLDPRYAKAYNNLGVISKALGQLEQAEYYYKKAIQIDPSMAEAHSNLGVIYKNRGNYFLAEQSYRRAIEIKPNYAEANNNLGGLLQELGDYKEAQKSYERAFKADNKLVESQSNLGGLLFQMGHMEAAEKACKKALEIDPLFSEAYYNLANVLMEKKQLLPALENYKKSLTFNPGLEDAYINKMTIFQEICDWEAFDKLSKQVDKMTMAAIFQREKPAETPFLNLTRVDDPRTNLMVSRAWSRHITQKIKIFKPYFSFNKKKISNKIRIGYISYDFWDHPVAHIIKSMFANHNKKKFEIYIYSYGPDDKSQFTKKIIAGSDKFIDIKDYGYVDAAKLIYKDEIDILVDLMGHTRGNRLEILALQPAPIQVTYLGLCGTTGSTFIDYSIVDKIIVPKNQERFYTEKLVYMPDCYQVNDFNQPISKQIMTHQDFNLPKRGIVFCSFNNAAKIEPMMFDIWMKILKKLPKSVFWLYTNSDVTEKNLRKEAAKRGVNPKRLIFTYRLPLNKHLTRLALADISLDTRLYNGGATTSNALWAGVPVITLQGNSYISRMSSSLLTAVGLKTLIARSLKEYERLAINLAQNPKKLKKIKNLLKKNRLTKPLFNTKLFTKNLETAYKQMWKIHQLGKKPETIDVKILLQRS